MVSTKSGGRNQIRWYDKSLIRQYKTDSKNENRRRFTQNQKVNSRYLNLKILTWSIEKKCFFRSKLQFKT